MSREEAGAPERAGQEGRPEPAPARRLRAETPRNRLHEPWLTPARLLALVAVLIAAYAALTVVQALRGLLMMLLVALFLSFAMEPAVQWLAQRGWRRGAATGMVFILAFLITAAIVAAMTPLVVDQITGLVASVPRSLDEVTRLASRLPFFPDLETTPEVRREVVAFTNEMGERLRTIALGAAGDVVNIGATAIGLIARALAVALLTFYLVADGPRLRRTLARPLPPHRQREMLAIWELAVAKTGGYIYARLLIMIVSAVAHGLLLVILGVPYPLPLGIWMGLMSAFVPIVGVYIGSVLLLIVAGVNEAIHALWVFAFVVVYQQFENYVLGPKVQAHTMNLHPAVAFFSVLVGATLLGAVGALLALPAAAIVKALLSTYLHRHELIDELAVVPLEGVTTPSEEPADQTPEPSYRPAADPGT